MHATITINGKPYAHEAKSLSDILSAQGISPAQGGVAVAVNQKVIAREAWSGLIPQPQDSIEIITAMAGG